MLAVRASHPPRRNHLRELTGAVPLGEKQPLTEPGIPAYVEGILHQHGRRLRFRIIESANKAQTLRYCELLLAVDSRVDRVRVNPLAGCCIVMLQEDNVEAVKVLLEILPTDLEGLQAAARELQGGGDEELQKAKAEQSGSLADEEDRFVPQRIILPLSSLALALLAGPLSLPPLAVGGFILVAAHLSFKRAAQGIIEERRVNVDFLDALAVTLHSLEGFLVGPALMISMIEGGEAVRDATQRTALSANTDLLAGLQTNVRLLVDGGEVIVPSHQLTPGDRISLFPGDQIPIDGVIESGEGSLEVVKLTGESVPRFAGAGDEVLAGFILLDGSLIVETRATGKETRIGQITSLIEAAPVFDTRVGNVAGRVANRFVIPTLLLAGVSLLFSAGNIAQAASLLMFDLGTGLRVSVPTAIMAALSKAGSHGLLIRSGRALEQLVDVDVVVFDKTGTLTQGHPSVVRVDLINGGELLPLMQLAISAEQGLNHPVAKAIVEHGEKLGITPLDCEDWGYRIGHGVVATIDGHEVLVGNGKLLEAMDVDVPNHPNDKELETATPVYLVVDKKISAILYTEDALRRDSRELVAELHRRGIQTHMLTGDVSSVAHAVARRLGLAEEEVHAEALPDEKANLVKRLCGEGYKVAFVGDGINDSAALAYADVSVSFASGSDLARETADIVLTNDRVSDLLLAKDLAELTFELVRQNIGIVGIPNLSALLLGTFIPVSPITAVLLNNGSCLVAAANAMRVLGFQAKPNAVDTTVEIPMATTTTMTCVELAERLGVSRQIITARRGRNDFKSWVATQDPDGLSWSYCQENRLYETSG